MRRAFLCKNSAMADHALDEAVGEVEPLAGPDPKALEEAGAEADGQSGPQRKERNEKRSAGAAGQQPKGKAEFDHGDDRRQPAGDR